MFWRKNGSRGGPNESISDYRHISQRYCSLRSTSVEVSNGYITLYVRVHLYCLVCPLPLIPQAAFVLSLRAEERLCAGWRRCECLIRGIPNNIWQNISRILGCPCPTPRLPTLHLSFPPPPSSSLPSQPGNNLRRKSDMSSSWKICKLKLNDRDSLLVPGHYADSLENRDFCCHSLIRKGLHFLLKLS